MATQQNGIVAGNKQNAPGGSTKNARSLFPLSMSQFQTERFADLTPFEVMEGVSSDKLPLHSNHEVQTYTLKSPILQSLSKKKDFFAVPMQAILPLNWEKFYTNPNIGQDVPDDCGLGVEEFWLKMRTLFFNSYNYLLNTYPNNASYSDATYVEYWFRFALFFEQIYSCGSLMETLNISGHNWFRCKFTESGGPVSEPKEFTFDDMFDGLCSRVSTALSTNTPAFINITIGGVTYDIVSNPVEFTRSATPEITLREALELMRDDLTFTVNSLNAGTLELDLQTYLSELDFDVYGGTSPLNLGRLWAYQLVCAHFMSNDHIDFIYSADLFRQYIGQLSSLAFSNPDRASFPCFTVNGLQYQYDYLSAYVFNQVYIYLNSTSGIFRTYISSGSHPDSLYDAYAYFTALFSFKKSLRFLDYFSGSRAYPLAVGDHNATIGTDVAGKLDVIELSRVSMMTKFLQAVNRSGRKFSAYMQELFGKVPAYDYHNPMFLAHQSDLVGAPETENTGAAQVTDKLAVTSRLKATASRYAFEFTPDRDCIVIGITYYDIPRVYTRATERQNFVIDRFDMFNTYLQYTGDQSISEAELGTNTPDFDRPFSYTNRDMQYKQRFNQANGGFCNPSTGLDNWIFVADELRRKYFHQISPSFIRSFNCEIDRFYQRLTGYSLGTYFHFIVRYDNRMDASRPMAFNPTINV